MTKFANNQRTNKQADVLKTESTLFLSGSSTGYSRELANKVWNNKKKRLKIRGALWNKIYGEKGRNYYPLSMEYW